jgi:hypothetical protein
MMHRSDAETLALKGLAFLAREPEQLLRLLTLTGLELSDLRARAGDPELLAAVMDFLLAEESLLVPFAADAGLDVKQIHAARQALPGAGEL